MGWCLLTKLDHWPSGPSNHCDAANENGAGFLGLLEFDIFDNVQDRMIDEGNQSQKRLDISMVLAGWYPTTLEVSSLATTFSIRCIATTSFEPTVAHTRVSPPTTYDETT
jgi:hypothetical protein